MTASSTQRTSRAIGGIIGGVVLLLVTAIVLGLLALAAQTIWSAVL